LKNYNINDKNKERRMTLANLNLNEFYVYLKNMFTNTVHMKSCF